MRAQLRPELDGAQRNRWRLGLQNQGSSSQTEHSFSSAYSPSDHVFFQSTSRRFRSPLSSGCSLCHTQPCSSLPGPSCTVTSFHVNARGGILMRSAVLCLLQRGKLPLQCMGRLCQRALSGAGRQQASKLRLLLLLSEGRKSHQSPQQQQHGETSPPGGSSRTPRPQHKPDQRPGSAGHQETAGRNVLRVPA